MNNNFVNQNTFPNRTIYRDNGMTKTLPTYIDNSFETSYIHNLLKLNKGKQVEIYTSYPDSNEWRDKIFLGIIEESEKDYIILSDPKTGDWYVIPTIYIDYIRSNERIISGSEFLANN